MVKEIEESSVKEINPYRIRREPRWRPRLGIRNNIPYLLYL
jgi:hypothetical protein